MLLDKMDKNRIRRLRGLLGWILLTSGLFCILMSQSSNILGWVLSVWYIGWLGTYIYMADQYMTIHNIYDAKNTTELHENCLNDLFLKSLLWSKIWLK